jgi:phage baseplate assembly protein W
MTVKRIKEQQKYQQSGGPTEIYSDFVQSFFPHPTTGNISRRVNVDSVKMGLRNLILTNKYERLKNPSFGTNIRRHLFELFTETTASDLENDIRDAIENYEPRVRIIELNVIPNEDQNQMTVNLLFSVITNQEPQNLELTLFRVR